MTYDIESPATGESGSVEGPPKDVDNDCASLGAHGAGLLPVHATNPPGLIGLVRQFIYDAAPHPNNDIALAGAIALLAGVSGRAYNTYTNAGLNQYILLLASTGLGKEAAASGISKLLQAVAATVPAAGDFKGPALVSSAGLVKWLDKKPSVVTVAGECGYMLNRISSPKANPNDQMLKATLLVRLYYSSTTVCHIMTSDKAARSPGAHVLIAMIAVVTHALAGLGQGASKWSDDVRRRNAILTQEDFFRSFPMKSEDVRARASEAFKAQGFE